MYYTYLHRRASDNQPFYIGKGKRKDRMTSKSGRSERWLRVVAKHGLRVEVVAPWETEAQAFEHEKFLIACFKDMGFDIVNHTEGGDGASGFKQTEATKMLRNSKLRGMKRTPETIARMTAAKVGVPKSEEQKAKIAQTLAGRYPGGLNPNAKAVECVETGAQFGSMVEAAEWLRSLGHHKASFKSVHGAVSGQKKTAYGYSWRRA